MMNELHMWDEYKDDSLNDGEYGLELRSTSSDDDQAARPRQRIVLIMPPEWLDPKEPLPTDREFHRWIQQQLRIHTNGGIIHQRRRHTRHNTGGAGADDQSLSSQGSGKSQFSWSGVVQKVSHTLAGVRKRNNASPREERQTLLEDDSFGYEPNLDQWGVVGMELSVMS